MSARASLLERLRRDAYRAGSFTLASGKTSDFFIDCKRVILTAQGHVWVGEAMLEVLLAAPPGERAQGVAGVALGGCPLASAVSLTSALRGAPMDALYVRKEAKDHGTRALIEGTVTAGLRLALLEDVLTTGGSSRAAIDRLREAGHTVTEVVALVDRREGGVEALREAGLRATALFAREDFVS